MSGLKLMADYGCFPLWHSSAEEVGNVNPDSLPISQSLKTELADWAAAYDKTLDHDDPMNSGFSSDEEAERFKQEGRLLARRLQIELGPSYSVEIKV